MRRFNQRGAALIGAVALAAILSITAVGFLSVATNESINETKSYYNDKAFHTAESGLLLGSGWLRTQNPFPAAGQTFTPFSGVQINNFYVDVTIKTYIIDGTPSAQIISEVYDHPSIRTSSKFIKRLRYGGVTEFNFYKFAHFFNDAPNNWAGFDHRYFDGSFHMNERIYIHSQNNDVVFTDKVTVANSIDDHWDYGDGSHHNNNYDWGVQLNNKTPGDTAKAQSLDRIFEKEYLANMEKIVVPDEYKTLVNDLIAKTDISLPWSTDEGEGASDYRPTLRYNMDGTATYCYHNGSTYDSTNIGNTNQKIVTSQNNINVFGRVKGNTTLVTPFEKSIFIVNDIVYADYNPSSTENNGIPLSSTNSLGLVSGKHIVFHEEWKPTISGTTQKIVGSLVPHIPGQLGQLHLNASMIALMEEPKGGQKWWGTELWNKVGTYDYELYFTGSHLLAYYTDPSTGGGANGGANDLYYRWDRRLLDTIRPLGFPSVGLQTESGLLLLSLSGWSEENIY